MSGRNEILLGQLAIRKRFITSDDLVKCLVLQRKHGGLLGEILVSQGFISEEQLAALIEEQKSGGNGSDTQKISMSCRKCGSIYNVVNPNPNSFYRCPNCSGVLMSNFQPITISDQDTPNVSQTVTDLPDDVKIALTTGGSTVGKFLLVELIGKGGFGQVYKAFDLELERIIALKILTPHGEVDIERTRLEAQLAARLQVEGIPRIFETAVINETTYIAMEYIDGRPTSELKLTRDETLKACKEVALALHSAHAQGIVHRDIKPSNIIVDKNRRAWLADFGIAKVTTAESGLTKTGDIVGTPHFMSPEQAGGRHREVDARSDIFSLGATLYYLLSGSFPFTGKNVFEMMRAVMMEDPPPLTSIDHTIPAELDAIVGKAMQKENRKRYNSAKEFADDIDRYLNGEPVRARRTGIVGKITSRARKNRNVLALSSALVLVLAIAGGLSFYAGKSREEAKETADEAKRKEEEALRAKRELINVFVDTMRKAILEAVESRRTGTTLEQLRRIPSRTVDLYNRIQEQGVRDSLVHHLLGRLYRLIDDDAAAIEQQELALALEPNLAAATAELVHIDLKRYSNELSKARDGLIHIESQNLFGPNGTAKMGTTIPEPTNQELGSFQPKLLKMRESAAARARIALQGLAPRSTEQTLMTAVVLFLEEKFAESLKYGDLVLSKEPFNEDAALLKAAILEKSGKLREAIESLTNSLRPHEMNPALLRKRADSVRSLFFSGGSEPQVIRANLLLGIDDLTKLIKFADKISSIWRFRARLRYLLTKLNPTIGTVNESDLSGALEDARMAVALDPNDPEAWRIQGTIQSILGSYNYDQGRDGEHLYSTAIESLVNATKLAPEDSGAWSEFGSVLSEYGTYSAHFGKNPSRLYTDAVDCYDKSLRINARDSLAWRGRGNCLNQWGEFEMSCGDDPIAKFVSAIENYDTALTLGRSGGWDIRVDISNTYRQIARYKSQCGKDSTEEFEKSVVALEEALRANPDNSYAVEIGGHVYLAWSEHNMVIKADPIEKLKKSIEYGEKLVRVSPSDFSGWLILGRAHFLIGTHYVQTNKSPCEEFNQSIECLSKGIELNKTLYLLYSDRGNAYAGLAIHELNNNLDSANNFGMALEDLTTSIDLNSLHYDGIRRRGRYGYFYARYVLKDPKSKVLIQAIEDLERALSFRKNAEPDTRTLLDEAKAFCEGRDY